MTREDFRKKLQQIINIANQLDMELNRQQKSPQEESPGECPIHHVPWCKFDFGWAHPPTEEGGKWCKKKDIDKLL